MARLLFEVSVAVAMQCDISHFQFNIYTLFVVSVFCLCSFNHQPSLLPSSLKAYAAVGVCNN